MFVNQVSNENVNVDAFIPSEMAERAEHVGVTKANLPAGTMFLLAVLAGAFIALGSVFSTTVVAGSGNQFPFGVTKLLGGLTFSLGLILVVVAGAELFTGNNLKVMAVASGKVSFGTLLRGWSIVYVGNFVGSVATAAIVFIAGQYGHGNGAVGTKALEIASAKCQLGFVQAIALGVLCNALVCLAIWLCYSARSTTDKILSIIFPITAFVAAGFEHCVANMYMIPFGIFIKNHAPESFWEMTVQTPGAFAAISWNNFLFANLIPVTIGNVFGGSVMVGLVYWFIYLRKRKKTVEEGTKTK